MFLYKGLDKKGLFNRKTSMVLVRSLSALLLLIPASILPAQAQTFQVADVVFSESVYLQPAILQEIEDRYTNRDVTFADLQAMVGEVQTLYSEAGIVTAQVVIPPQDLVGGVLNIELVEATLESVTVEGFGATHPDFIRRNLALNEGTRPDFVQIERDLRIFDLAHDISPRISFAPGLADGTTVAVISGEAPQRNTFGVSLDDYGREETGEARLTLSAVRRNLTGVRDTLTGQLTLTEGSYSGNIGYSRPVGPGGGRLLASLSMSKSQIVSGTFTPIQIESDTSAITLAYSRPMRVRAFSQIMLETGIAAEQSSSTTGGLLFADVTLSEFYVQARYARRLENSAFGLSLGLRFGSSDAAGTTATEGSYALIYGDASYARAFGQHVAFDANLRFQLAPDANLPVARLFSIGGVGSVRGYPNDIRSGDSGMVLKLQVSKRTPFDLADGNLAVTPFAFADIGIAVPFRATNAGFDGDQDLLYSVGFGTRIGLRDMRNLQAVALVGLPIKETLGLPDPRARFYLGLDQRF
jgi:hemolysin activation/secretion protein